MNLLRTNFASFFLFDESASGTGGASSPPGGTASPAPAAAPSSPAAPPSPSPGSGSPDGSAAQPSPSGGAAAAPSEHDPFAGLNMDFGDLDEVILPGQPPVTVTGSGQPGAQPAPQPAQPPAPGAPAPAPAPAVPPAQPVAAPAAATAPLSPRDQLRQTVDGFRTNAGDLAKWAGAELFKLSDEEVTALTTDAPTAIPAIAGRVYAQSLHAAANLIQNLVPSLVESMIEQQHGTRTRATEAMNQFWAENKDLNAKDHGELVTSWAKQFRAANPKASRAEAIAFVARAVRVQAGLPIPQPGGGPAPAPAPAAPQAFAPARPGGRQPVPPAEHDPYAGLGMDFDDNGAIIQ